MKNFLPAILLLCVALAFAQTQKRQDTQPSSTDNQTKVQGCLSGSAGNYTLTDSSGQTYQLTGDTSMLKEHVGHKVEISGATSSASGMPNSSGSNSQTSATSSNPYGSSTAPNSSNPPSAGTKNDQSNPSSSGAKNPSSSGGAGSQTLNVSSVKHISESCDTSH